MKVIYSKKLRQPFLICLQCGRFYSVTLEMAENYLNRNPHHPVLCPKCAGVLKAMERKEDGRIYARCCKDRHHTFSVHRL